uniref:Uncharacterized protein n=1 Tax=Cannabis sativa TaxID=3483 RepID=A0A803NKC4_CANSA
MSVIVISDDTFEEHEEVTKSQVASEEEAESPLKKVKLEKNTNRTPIPCLNLPPPEEVVEMVNKEKNDNTAEIVKDDKDDGEPVKDDGEPVNVKPEGK